MNLRSITESRGWAWLINSFAGKDSKALQPLDLLPFDVDDQKKSSNISQETHRVFASLIKDNKLSPYVLGLAVTADPEISRHF